MCTQHCCFIHYLRLSAKLLVIYNLIKNKNKKTFKVRQKLQSGRNKHHVSSGVENVCGINFFVLPVHLIA